DYFCMIWHNNGWVF
nr:immunoglobulin light chain junction region [Macaca mulatta]MOX30929.1 immunoglobulin light chain junction region [Macaca mulatta]